MTATWSPERIVHFAAPMGYGSRADLVSRFPVLSEFKSIQVHSY
jgi:hypothetical protein